MCCTTPPTSFTCSTRPTCPGRTAGPETSGPRTTISFSRTISSGALITPCRCSRGPRSSSATTRSPFRRVATVRPETTRGIWTRIPRDSGPAIRTGFPMSKAISTAGKRSRSTTTGSSEPTCRRARLTGTASACGPGPRSSPATRSRMSTIRSRWSWKITTSGASAPPPTGIPRTTASGPGKPPVPQTMGAATNSSMSTSGATRQRTRASRTSRSKIRPGAGWPASGITS